MTAPVFVVAFSPTCRRRGQSRKHDGQQRAFTPVLPQTACQKKGHNETIQSTAKQLVYGSNYLPPARVDKVVNKVGLARKSPQARSFRDRPFHWPFDCNEPHRSAERSIFYLKFSARFWP